MKICDVCENNLIIFVLNYILKRSYFGQYIQRMGGFGIVFNQEIIFFVYFYVKSSSFTILY